MKLLIFILFTLATVAAGAETHTRVYAVVLANDTAGAFLGASSKGSGLYQSDDTGKTWVHLGWDNVKSYSMDVVRSSNGNILYLATGLGVLKSIDAGVQWKQVTDWHVAEVMDIAVNQGNPSEIWIATPSGPWQSLDTGKTWTLRSDGMKQKYCSRIMFDTTNYTTLALAAEDGLYTLRAGAKVWKRIPKIDRPVRALAYYAGGWNAEGDGISARVHDDSVTALKHRDVIRWTISIDPSHADPFFLFGGPAGADWHRAATGEKIEVKDVASSALIAPEILLGTLGKGVYRRSTDDYALDGRQVWTLKIASISK